MIPFVVISGCIFQISASLNTVEDVSLKYVRLKKVLWKYFKFKQVVMADHKNSFSEDSSTQNNEEKMQKSSDFEVNITRAGYLGSDPDKVKTINMTKLKAEITKVGLF